MTTNTDIEKMLTQVLLSIINDTNIQDFYTFDNQPKDVTSLTREQASLIEDINNGQIKLYSKLKAIDLLAKISGLNSSTTKLEGGETPVSINFDVNFTTPSQDE